MDTRLRKFNKVGYALYCVVWVLAIVVATASFISLSVFFAQEEMLIYNDISLSEEEGTHYYAGRITDVIKFNKLMDLNGWVFISSVILFILLMFVILASTGKFNKEADGKYSLNWFDKLWSELHIAACIASGALCFCPVEYLINLWEKGLILGIWQWANHYEEKVYATNVELFIVIACLVFAVITSISCLVSVVKKIKAGEFWEKSLLGGSFFLIWRAIKSSDKTLTKVMCLLIGGAIVSATWVGLILVIILIVALVPKLVDEFLEVKKGVEEVKNGNLTYKIPVTEDAKGIKGEFGKLAMDINEISQASNIAIQNELKSQRLKTELISNVSHDLKTPLTSMVSYIDLLKQEGLDSPNAPEYLDIVDNKTQRLKVLTENLFEAAKASSGAIPVNMESIDITSLLSQLQGTRTSLL